jgi:ApaG protein
MFPAHLSKEIHCMSQASSQGIRVTVRTQYLPDQSSPADRRYVFAYTVVISNEGTNPAQLKSRHWIITDGMGRVEEVRGPGVVGKQPRLDPGEEFEYTSGCVLRTGHGSMRGTYQMLRDNGDAFDAEIATFQLSLPHSLN